MTWADLVDLAAESGLTEAQFFDMTPRQFAAWNRGVTQRQRAHIEAIRIQTYLICLPNLKRGTNMKKFWSLPWDETPKIPVQTPEEIAHFNTNARKIFELIKGKASGDN